MRSYTQTTWYNKPNSPSLSPFSVFPFLWWAALIYTGARTPTVTMIEFFAFWIHMSLFSWKLVDYEASLVYSFSGQKAWSHPWHTSSWTPHPKLTDLVGLIYSESNQFLSPLLLTAWWCLQGSPFTWHHTEDSELLALFPPCSPSVHPFLTRQPFT